MEKGRILPKLLVIMFLGIIVLGCTPKKPATVTETPTETATGTMTTGEDFFFDKGIGDYPQYPQFVVDNGGEYFIFGKNKALKDIRLISIGYSDEGNLYEDEVFTFTYDEFGFSSEGIPKRGISSSIPDEIDTFFIQAYVSEGIPNRGISFTDESENRRYYYISQSGMDGSVSLNEFQHNPSVSNALILTESDFKVEIMDVRGMGLELEESVKITEYTGSKQKVPKGISFDSFLGKRVNLFSIKMF